MALKTSDYLLGPSRVTDDTIKGILERLDRPDVKDAGFLVALRNWCRVAGVDDANAISQVLWETDNMRAYRWNSQLNPAGIGITSDGTAQPFKIASVDESARLLVQCIYSMVKKQWHPDVPIPDKAKSWMDGIWLNKVRSLHYPKGVDQVKDQNIIYYTPDGDWHATWAADDGYMGHVARGNYFMPTLPDQGQVTLPAEEKPVATLTHSVPRPTIYNLASDYAKFGLTQNQANIILGHRFYNRNGGRPLRIVLHIQDGWTRGSLTHWTGVDASSTVMIQKDGSILQVIPEQHGPWTNGDTKYPTAAGQRLAALGGNANNWSLTIEAEGGPWDTMPEAQKNAIIWQVQDWYIRYPELREIGLAALIRHADVNTIDKINCGIYHPVIAAVVGPWLENGGVVDPIGQPYPKPITYDWLSPDVAEQGLDRKIGDTTVYYLPMVYTAVKRTPRRRATCKNTEVIGPPVEPGERFKAWYVYRSCNKTYVLTQYGTRIEASALEPKVQITLRGTISVRKTASSSPEIARKGE